jgi:hypothetical protein
MVKHWSGTRCPDDREVGWRCVQSILCTWRWGAQVSWLSLETKVDGLSVVWPQNHWDGFLRFGLKIGGNGFSRFYLKTSGSGFPAWTSKPTTTVWWLKPQNHSDGFLVWTSKPCWWWFVSYATKPTRGCDNVGHALGSIGLLCMKASRGRVFQFASKLAEAWRWVMHGTIMEVALRWSWRWMGRCDGLRRTLLPLFCHFHCIRPYGHNSLIIFYLSL